MSRYSNPIYREQQLERSRRARAKQKAARLAEKALNGWSCISVAPKGEVIKLYDPAIFWPVYARYDNGVWVGIHYSGKINPTHFKLVEKLPRKG